jgi:hypothetical protein
MGIASESRLPKNRNDLSTDRRPDLAAVSKCTRSAPNRPFFYFASLSCFKAGFFRLPAR